jgi:hypothetical protein
LRRGAKVAGDQALIPLLLKEKGMGGEVKYRGEDPGLNGENEVYRTRREENKKTLLLNYIQIINEN